MINVSSLVIFFLSSPQPFQLCTFLCLFHDLIPTLLFLLFLHPYNSFYSSISAPSPLSLSLPSTLFFIPSFSTIHSPTHSSTHRPPFTALLLAFNDQSYHPALKIFNNILIFRLISRLKIHLQPFHVCNQALLRWLFKLTHRATFFFNIRYKLILVAYLLSKTVHFFAWPVIYVKNKLYLKIIIYCYNIMVKYTSAAAFILFLIIEAWCYLSKNDDFQITLVCVVFKGWFLI